LTNRFWFHSVVEEAWRRKSAAAALGEVAVNAIIGTAAQSAGRTARPIPFDHDDRLPVRGRAQAVVYSGNTAQPNELQLGTDFPAYRVD
jgi:hypothetical protein